MLCANDMGSCQNSGPFLGTLNNRCRIIRGTQKGTIILTAIHMMMYCLLTTGSLVDLARLLRDQGISLLPLRDEYVHVCMYIYT